MKLIKIKEMAEELGMTKRNLANLKNNFVFPRPYEIVGNTHYYKYDELLDAIKNPISKVTGLPVDRGRRDRQRKHHAEHGNCKIKDLQGNIHYGEYNVNKDWDSHKSVDANQSYNSFD